MKFIQLRGKHRNKFFICSDEDFDELIKYKWRLGSTGNYVISSFWDFEKKKPYTVKLHRFIFKLNNSNDVVDHKNHNILDNRRENLRICKNSDNARNKRKSKQTWI